MYLYMNTVDFFNYYSFDMNIIQCLRQFSDAGHSWVLVGGEGETQKLGVGVEYISNVNNKNSAYLKNY
jgi:hypothetical protein